VATRNKPEVFTLKTTTMAKQKEGKKKSDKTAPAKTAKEKKAIKALKKQGKEESGMSAS
jgi:hypothetical protein